jgi:superfamily II DNA or RNA helicase
MSAHDWGALLPEDVSKWINFDRQDSEWNYAKDSISMESKQAEGVAYLWNLLSMNNVALLADEVGMGKTFQALGVAALLWKMKPDAKVLVMAPNKDICAHWRREFAAFVRFHYREIDHCVKYAADLGSIQSIQSCWKLEDLANSIETSPAHLYLTTISSLSGLVPAAEKGKDNSKQAAFYARIIHDRIKGKLGVGGFDLVIIDEAHYFRNVDGGSQRVDAARAFFGGRENPISRKALLLTATPTHTNSCNVESILGYFLDVKSEQDRSVTKLMKKYGLRRFRLMEGNGAYFSKHQYRHEHAHPSDFSEHPESELFFALYQKKLVTEVIHANENKRILYGYLEGFESVGRTATVNEGENEKLDDEVDETNRGDYGEARDTNLLRRLTGQYRESFGNFPDHPKYGDLVRKCTPRELFEAEAPMDLHEDKHLVFVRRIPSVRELTQRINAEYDEILAAKIYGAWGVSEGDAVVKKWKKQSWSRSGFDEMVRQLQPGNEDEDIEVEDDDVDEVESDSYLGSRISELFVVKKGGNARTDCSNVSLRFRKSESAFALFLEPASNYRTAGYWDYYELNRRDVNRPDYVKAASDKRLTHHELLVQKAEHVLLSGGALKKYDREMITAWSLVYPLLSQEQQGKLNDWAERHPDIAENFANYIKTGFLFASPVMVEIYAWFTEFKRKNTVADVQKKYADFILFVGPKIQSSLMLCYFKAAMDTFEAMCEKIIDHKPGEWEKPWRMLTSLQNPAWYASGQSKNRQRLILGFNSPFYPNVLVATSVFQEGVNLHMQCRKVHHYGIAWTPGDNEQRVGRVDRLFGKVNSLLKIDTSSNLEINYPFLKNSFDEDQVASFIAMKFDVENKMDSCIQSSSNREIELTQTNWREFLRKPVKSDALQDPYGAIFIEESMPTTRYVPFDNHQGSDVVEHIASLLKKVIDTKTDFVRVVPDGSHYPNALLLIEPNVVTGGESRRQPILVEKHFSSDFSALVSGAIYYISFKSPIASKEILESAGCDWSAKLRELYQELTPQYSLVKMAINPDLAKSHFYLNVRVDLPVFIKHGQLGLLSLNELEMAYNELKRYADRVEYELFSGLRDMGLDELNLLNLLVQDDCKSAEESDNSSSTKPGARWETVNTLFGHVERITGTVSLSSLLKRFPMESTFEGNQSLFLEALGRNDQFPFLKFQEIGNGFSVGIDYPSENFSPEERMLLEKWFDFVIER